MNGARQRNNTSNGMPNKNDWILIQLMSEFVLQTQNMSSYTDNKYWLILTENTIICA